MIKTYFTFLFFLVVHLVNGQTSSDYYQAPIDTVVNSKFLNENKNITVILPRSYNKEKATKFPLIVIFDRQNQRIFRQIFESINYLVSFNEMPECVIIGVSSDDSKRNSETSLAISRKSGTGEQNEAFIFDELIPFAEREYNTNKCNVLIGHSRYGYFTSYLLAKHLSQVTAVISFSPLFTDTNVNIVDSLKSNLFLNQWNHTVYYRFITGDIVTDTKDFLLMKSYLSKAKLPKNFNWKGLEFYDAKHMAVPGLGIMPALLETFDYWSDEMAKVLTENKKQFDKIEYELFLQKMKSHYGDKIGLGLGTLNGIGYKYYNEKKYAEARQAWQITIEEYPMFSYAYISIAKSYFKESKKLNAIEFYEKAKGNLLHNYFYADKDKQELLKDIEEGLKTVRQ
jgi:tetratricopeptide (TPR) repeat protein